MSALSQYVLKVHSRCDLACDHCYIYQHSDQTWRGLPKAIAPDIVRAAAVRIADHARAHRLRRVRLVLHGGEPLLLGPDRLRSTLAQLRQTIVPVTELDLRLQTNGVLLSPTVCDLFVEYGVKVGISLDGDATANDRHRRFADGASSHAYVRRALALLRHPAYHPIYAGILCTVDVANDPIRVYEALLAEAPPRIDLLLPHATWAQPPPRPNGAPTPYADWLHRIYQRWAQDGRPVPIRLFDSLLSTAAGGRSGTEAVGLDPADLVVIETDGSWEQADSMKTAFHGAASTGFDVFTHTLDEVAAHPAIAGRQLGLADLCQTCLQCPVVRQCGGGLRAHRYRSGNGFDNPSVYCADIKELILSMRREPPRVAQNVPREPSEHADGLLPDDLPLGELLDDLGSGYGSAATLERLAAAQLAIVRALLVDVADRVAGNSAAGAWDLLGQLDSAEPEAVEAVLTHPYTRHWAKRCLDPRAGQATDLTHLGALAAAAAVRAGVTVDVDVPVHAGLAHLPGLGALALDEPGADSVALSIADGGFTARARQAVVTVSTGGDSPPPATWQPARRAESADWSVLLEDLDPYRDCHDWPVTARLTAAETASWQRLLIATWSGIQRSLPGHVPGMRVALRTITPLQGDPEGRLRSATSRHAFGAIGTVAADADAFVILLTHEFQHVKLGAVMDLCDLFDTEYQPRLTVPWRPDPRPVEGVLQGTYAYLAIADIWRTRTGAEAAGQFRRCRAWTAQATDVLLATGALTAGGERLVRRMRETLDGWANVHP